MPAVIASHRRTFSQTFKTKWRIAAAGVTTVGVVTAGLFAAPLVFAESGTVALSASKGTISTGEAVALKTVVKDGNAQPVPYAKITLQRTIGQGWHTLSQGQTYSDGQFGWNLKPGKTSVFRVLYHGVSVKSSTPENSKPETGTPEGSAPEGGTVETSAPAEPVETGGSQVNSPEVRVNVQDRGAAVLKKAKTQAGKPYRYAASGPNSYDCSGFTQWTFKHFKIKLPHSATKQAAFGKSIGRSAIKPGDLLLFGSGGSYYHAGIYAGGNKMIDAPEPGKKVGVHKIWSNSYTIRRLV